MMKILNTVLMVLGVLLFLAGGIFFLQGLDVITARSFMRGDWHWIIYGAVIALAGIVLLAFARRDRGRTR